MPNFGRLEVGDRPKGLSDKQYRLYWGYINNPVYGWPTSVFNAINKTELNDNQKRELLVQWARQQPE